MRREQSIFIQIAETIKDRILSGIYQADERIPSVRDLAVEMEVNPNTVMRAFELLQSEEVIYNRRGIGYFTSMEAERKILAERRENMLSVILPRLVREVKALGIEVDEAKALLERYW